MTQPPQNPYPQGGHPNQPHYQAPYAPSAQAQGPVPPQQPYGVPPQGAGTQQRRRPWVVPVVIGVVLLLIVAIALFFYMRSASAAKGEDSPLEAADAFYDAVNDGDLTGVVRRFAPSELMYTKGLMAAVDRSAESGGETTRDAADTVEEAGDDLLESVTIELSDVESVVVAENEDLAIVAPKSGHLRLEVTDEEKFIDSVTDIYASGTGLVYGLMQPLLDATTGGDISGPPDEADIESFRRDLTESVSNMKAEGWDLADYYERNPYAPDGDTDPREARYAFYIVVAQEGGQWYFSPMSTWPVFSGSPQTIYSLLALGANGEELPAVPDAREYRSPEEAVEGFMQALTDGDTETMIASLGLAERRLMTMNGMFADGLDSFNAAGMRFTGGDYAVHTRDGVRFVEIVSGSLGDARGENELRIEEQQVTLVSQGHTGAGSQEILDLSDISANGLPVLAFATVPGERGWEISPAMTLSHWIVDGLGGADGEKLIGALTQAF